jgi:hypothetical protein
MTSSDSPEASSEALQHRAVNVALEHFKREEASSQEVLERA